MTSPRRSEDAGSCTSRCARRLKCCGEQQRLVVVVKCANDIVRRSGLGLPMCLIGGTGIVKGRIWTRVCFGGARKGGEDILFGCACSILGFRCGPLLSFASARQRRRPR